MTTTISKAFAVAAASAAAAAGAQTVDQEYKLEIDRVSLQAAIADFSQQTGLNVSLIAQDLKPADRLVGPVAGEYTVEAALDRIVGGSGLSYKLVNARTIAIVGPRAKLSAPAMRLVRLDPQAQSERQSATGGTRLRNPATPSDQRKDLEEVVVTAQKREELLQNVPISITVLGGNELDSSTNQGVSEALSQVPGVATSIAQQSGGTQVVIRGVTAGGPLFNGSSPVAYYLDSVPFGLVKTAIAPDSSAFDLERVEVLRGPQGTLYGASAQNGVVRVLTRDANVDDFELKARTALSSTKGGGENYRGDLAANVPIIPGKLAARAVVGYEEMSGWIDAPNRKDINDAQLRNFRLKVNAQPTDDLRVALSAWLARNDYGGPPVADESNRITALLDQSIETDYDAYNLRVSYDLPLFSISSATSYLEYENGGAVDLLPLLGSPDTPLFTGLESSVVSQEVILTSTPNNSWRWSIGGMYRDAEDRLLQTFVGFLAPIDFTDASESIAIFGEITRLMMDGKLELTAGLRHFEDDVTQRENVRNTGVTTEPLYRAARTFDADSPRFVITWHPVDNATLYTSYAEGFRSGFNQNANIPLNLFPPLDADNLRNYELGAKGNVAEGRLTYEAAVYYLDWQDVQQTTTVDFNGLPVTALVNGKSASGSGVEFAVGTQPIDGLELSVNFSWNDLSMDSPVFSGTGVLLFEEGDRLNLSPEYTVGASAGYEFPLSSSGYIARFSASATYTSEQRIVDIIGPDRVIALGEPMLIGRTSFSIEAPERWTAMLFVDNVSNEQDAPIRNTLLGEWDTRVRPRTMGLQLQYGF